LLSELLRLLERVDLLDVKGFDGTSPMATELSASAPRPASVRRLERSRSPYLALSGSWDDYLRSRSGNFRKHLRKYWRLLEQSGTMEVECMTPGADAVAQMADVFAVNEASWKAERGTNLFREPRVRAFFAELVSELAAREAIDLHTVRLDGRLAVYELCFDFGGRLFSYNGAYRADLGSGSPGTALTASVVESAFARGRTEYDMCRGLESYKLRWSETQRSEEQLFVPAARLSARVRTWLGPFLKAKLKQSPWLVEQADRLSGRLRKGVRSSI
jgi:CelD/BcsL family acetyltransferase involved in cellulose biosynthesis